MPRATARSAAREKGRTNETEISVFAKHKFMAFKRYEAVLFVEFY
jgi:hypothetical protein